MRSVRLSLTQLVGEQFPVVAVKSSTNNHPLHFNVHPEICVIILGKET